MKSFFFVLFFISFSTKQVNSQRYTPDLQDKSQVTIIGRSVTNIQENGKKGIKIDPGQGSTLMMINNILFRQGNIEFDVKGKNLMGESFLGFAFHIQSDSTYDAVYFRPFNFANPDTIRRWRAVQYISLPEFDWDKLRQQFPGKYENKVNPAPDGDSWFHCKINVDSNLIRVFVNNSVNPSLVVNKLTNTTNGKIALWVETGSEGSFANLIIGSKSK